MVKHRTAICKNIGVAHGTWKWLIYMAAALWICKKSNKTKHGDSEATTGMMW